MCDGGSLDQTKDNDCSEKGQLTFRVVELAGMLDMESSQWEATRRLIVGAGPFHAQIMTLPCAGQNVLAWRPVADPLED